MAKALYAMLASWWIAPWDFPANEKAASRRARCQNPSKRGLSLASYAGASGTCSG